ncbi:hypothetical protein VNO77_03030 [Canavalia gladiata]|uniref:Uncharacterized protein n=1 Tax=Canavalia gladiata TaxID=3824 RepID=A0AAN9R6G3_CANGL
MPLTMASTFDWDPPLLMVFTLSLWFSVSSPFQETAPMREPETSIQNSLFFSSPDPFTVSSLCFFKVLLFSEKDPHTLPKRRRLKKNWAPVEESFPKKTPLRASACILFLSSVILVISIFFLLF